MKMKKIVSALCAAAVLLTSVVGANLLFSPKVIQAEDIDIDIAENGTEEPVQLTAPQNLRYEDGYIKWDKAEEAYGYSLRLHIGENEYEYPQYDKYFDYDNDKEPAQVELDRFCYENNIDFGEYTFDVCTFDEARNCSEWSDPITAAFEPTLTAPTNVRSIQDEDEIVTWDEVEGAYRYNIRFLIDDDEKTLYTSTYEFGNVICYNWIFSESGNYWISIQTMDQDYSVSEWTEPLLITHVQDEKLDTPQNVRFDETGENILWDEVEGADFYYVSIDNLSVTDDSGSQFGFGTNQYTDKPYFNNWKSYAAPYCNGEYAISVSAHSNESLSSDSSEIINVSYKHPLEETIDMPETIQLKDGYLAWDAVDNANIYWINFLVNGKIENLCYAYYIEAEYYNECSYYIGNKYPAGSYEVDLYVIDENQNYNKKTYSLTLDTPQDETIWTPYMHYKGDVLLWDFDRFRHDKTDYFWIRVRNAADGSIVRLETTWSEYIYGFTDLPNGDYLIDACVYENNDTLGSWSTPLNLFLHEGSGFDKENESTEEVIVPPEIENTVPEDDRITSITINPAFNLKFKDDDGNTELDLTDIKIKAEAIYDEDGIKRVEEALGRPIKKHQQLNLLDLTLLYKGEDFSNGYEGLVQVIIPLPKGHKDKTFSCFRITKDENGNSIKEVIPGEQTEDSYIIYLEHFSEYALLGEGEHTHEFGEEWKSDETNHWKECECGEKSDEAPHNFTEWDITKEATETETGERERECKVCGYKETEAIPVLPHTHTYPDEWKYNSANHWKECECGEKSEEASHDFTEWDITKEATETETGERERTCTVCGYKETETIPVLPHTHTYPDEWKYNSANHWKECDCGEKSDEAPHDFGEWSITKEAAEAEEGERIRECQVCGYKQTETLPKLTPTAPPETEAPDDNPGTGIVSLELSAILFAVCGAGIIFASKKIK